jgi:F0F1-type ATP synthase assembly protein I
MWVDATLGTKPWATLILSLLGISAGIVGVYRLVTTSIEQATSEMHKNDADKLSDEERGQDRRS